MTSTEHAEKLTARLHAAMAYLAERCDYAHELDGAGFNAYDAMLGHRLAERDPGLWTYRDASTAWKMLRKYRGQLEGGGHDLSGIPEPDVEHDPEWKAQAEESAKRRLILAEDGEHIFLKFPYDQDMVGKVRALPDRKWNPDDKAWMVPVTKGALRLLGILADQEDFEAEPEVAALMDGIQIHLSRFQVWMEDEHVVVDPQLSDALRQQFRKDVKGLKLDEDRGVWLLPKESLPSLEQLMRVADAVELAVDPAVIEHRDALKAQVAKLHDLSSAAETDADLDIPGLGGQLYPFQRVGVQYAHTMKRAMIADEMGLGKTVQALATIQLEDAFPAVVVCPASLKLNWVREVKAWLPGRSVKAVWGRKQADIDADVIVLNYAVLRYYVDRLNAMEPSAVIMDESHYVKNHKAARTLAARALVQGISVEDAGKGGRKNGRAVPIRLLLTGTPVLNRPQELISQLGILDRLNELGGFWHFAQHYCDAQNNGYGLDMTGAIHLDELNERLRGCCFVRRRKADVLKELPPKTRTVVPMEITNGKEYRAAHQDVVDWLGSSARLTAEFVDELRKKHPADEWQWRIQQWRSQRAERAAGPAEALVRIEVLKQLAAEGKMKAMVEWLTDFLEAGEKVVVFAHHRDIQRQLIDALADWKPVHILGEDGPEDRQNAVDAFQDSDGVRICICSLKAAGVGLTLTAASHVVFTELGWTPAEHDQAEDRLHRIGQAGAVNCWYLIGEDTVDQTIWQLLAKKRNVVDQATDGVPAGADVHMLNELLTQMAPGWSDPEARLRDMLDGGEGSPFV